MKIIACFLIGKQEKEELLCPVFVCSPKNFQGLLVLFFPFHQIIVFLQLAGIGKALQKESKII